jgi:DNA-binding NarL/FixJ family response regulator
MAKATLYGRELWEEILGARKRDHAVRVLRLAAEGMTDAEIAAELVYSTETIKWRWDGIRDMLGARNRTHAVAQAFRAGWIE